MSCQVFLLFIYFFHPVFPFQALTVICKISSKRTPVEAMLMFLQRMLLCQWGRECRDCTHPQCQRRKQPWTGPRNPFGQSWSGCPGPGDPTTPEPLAGCTHATDKYTHTHTHIRYVCVCMCVFFSSLYNLHPSQKYKEILCSILIHCVPAFLTYELRERWGCFSSFKPAHLHCIITFSSIHSVYKTLNYANQMKNKKGFPKVSIIQTAGMRVWSDVYLVMDASL